MRCNICGKDVPAGEGEDTVLGFVCRECYHARDFKLCAECGRRFPRDEMVEWNGLFYCRSDYFRAKERLERIREEERKKKEEEEKKKQPPLLRPGSGIGIPIKREKKEALTKDEINSLLGKINERTTKMNKMKRKAGAEEIDEEASEKEVISKKDLISIIDSLSSKSADIVDTVTDATIESFGDISLSDSSRRKRRDAISAALDELNELLRKKRK
ncbi:MAG: LIM domain-containing protein [Candidatus Micrarchaeia archaeon]